MSGALVSQLLGGVTSGNSLVPELSVTTSEGAAKAETNTLAAGDKLVAKVSFADPEIGDIEKTYTISVKTIAVSSTMIYATSVVNPDLIFSREGLSGRSSDGASYLQTSAASIGDWVIMPFAVAESGTYMVQLVYKAGSGRATIQNYVGDIAVGPSFAHGTAQAGDPDAGTLVGASSGKFYMKTLTDGIHLEAGAHGFKTEAVTTGQFVLQRLIITKVE